MESVMALLERDDEERRRSAARQTITPTPKNGRFITPDERLEMAKMMADIHSTTEGAERAITAPTPFHALIDEVRAIHDTKNKDYADSKVDAFRNFRRCEEVGVAAHMGCFVRCGDKWMRMENLLRREGAGEGGPAVKDEALEDTALDLAVYLMIFVLLRREWRAAKGGD